MSDPAEVVIHHRLNGNDGVWVNGYEIPAIAYRIEGHGLDRDAVWIKVSAKSVDIQYENDE